MHDRFLVQPFISNGLLCFPDHRLIGVLHKPNKIGGSPTTTVLFFRLIITEVFNGGVPFNIVSVTKRLMHRTIDGGEFNFRILSEMLGCLREFRFGFLAMPAPYFIYKKIIN